MGGALRAWPGGFGWVWIRRLAWVLLLVTWFSLVVGLLWCGDVVCLGYLCVLLIGVGYFRGVWFGLYCRCSWFCCIEVGLRNIGLRAISGCLAVAGVLFACGLRCLLVVWIGWDCGFCGVFVLIVG